MATSKAPSQRGLAASADKYAKRPETVDKDHENETRRKSLLRTRSIGGDGGAERGSSGAEEGGGSASVSRPLSRSVAQPSIIETALDDI
jgi:hypothetical protein